MLESDDGCSQFLLHALVNGRIRDVLLINCGGSKFLFQVTNFDFVALDHCHLDFAKVPTRVDVLTISTRCMRRPNPRLRFSTALAGSVSGPLYEGGESCSYYQNDI